MIVRQLGGVKRSLVPSLRSVKYETIHFKYPFNIYNRFQSTSTKFPQLTLYTGTDCQLCDVAKEVLDSIKKEVPFTLNLYNIRDDSLPEINKWRRAYQYDIPVLHLNGQEIARHRLNKDKVIDEIQKAIASSTSKANKDKTTKA